MTTYQGGQQMPDLSKPQATAQGPSYFQKTAGFDPTTGRYGMAGAPSAPSGTATSTGTPASPVPAPSQYSVKPGDTLYSIAGQYGTSVQDIMNSNKGVSDVPTPNTPLSIPNTPTPASTTQKYQKIFGTPPKTDLKNPGEAQSYISQVTPQTPPPEDPATQAVNSVMEQYVQDTQNLNTFEAQHQTVTEFQNNLAQQYQVPEMQRQLMSINTVMNGTEDDIRSEISAAGGFATESQVQGMVYTRNKGLVKQATNIENQLANSQQNLQMAVQSYQADYSQTSQALSDRISGDSNILSLFTNMKTQATSQYDKIVTNIGYKGLAQSLATSDPSGQSARQASQYLFGSPDILSNPTAVSSLETYREKQLKMSNQRLSIQVGTPGQANDTVGSLAQMLVDRTIAPSQLSKRSTGITSYGNILQAANDISMKTTGQPFDAAKADQAFAFGKSNTFQQTQTGLGFAKNTLDTLKTLSNKIDRGNITYGNQAGQWIKYNGSDPNTVNFITKANISIDDVGAALGGGVSTDAKLAIAKSIIDPTLSQQAFTGQVNQLISSVVARQNEYAKQVGEKTTVGGVVYPVGQSISDGKSSFTVNIDGTLTGPDGTIYNVDDSGNITNQ